MIVLIALNIFNDRPKSLEIEARLERAQSHLSELENQKRIFEQLSDYFRTRSFEEKEARIKFNLKKPGEEVYIIKKDQIKSQSTEVEIESSFWSSVKEWLKSD